MIGSYTDTIYSVPTFPNHRYTFENYIKNGTYWKNQMMVVGLVSVIITENLKKSSSMCHFLVDFTPVVSRSLFAGLSLKL